MTQTMIEYTGKSIQDLQVSAAGGSGHELVTRLKNGLYLYTVGILLRNIPPI